MPEMVSKIAHTFGGRELRKGQRFTAQDRWVAMLIATGTAELVPGENRDEYRTTAILSVPRKKRRH